MTTASTITSKRGTWLVIGLLALATVLVIVSRIYRTPAPQDWQEILQQPGFPAARRGMNLSQEGKKLLPAEEQREMDILYAEAVQSLTPKERQRFWTMVQKGTTATDQEISEGVDLIQRALHSLPPDKRTRLFALIEKAVQLQLTRQKRAEN
jgi:hypothetical protein